MLRAPILLLALAARTVAAAQYPDPVSADFTIRDFRFASGETLPSNCDGSAPRLLARLSNDWNGSMQ